MGSDTPTPAAKSAKLLAYRIGIDGIQLLFALNSIGAMSATAKERFAKVTADAVMENADLSEDLWWESLNNLLMNYQIYADVLADFVQVVGPKAIARLRNDDLPREVLEQLSGITALVEDMTEEEKELMKFLPQKEEPEEMLLWGPGTTDIN